MPESRFRSRSAISICAIWTGWKRCSKPAIPRQKERRPKRTSNGRCGRGHPSCGRRAGADGARSWSIRSQNLSERGFWRLWASLPPSRSAAVRRARPKRRQFISPSTGRRSRSRAVSSSRSSAATVQNMASGRCPSIRPSMNWPRNRRRIMASRGTTTASLAKDRKLSARLKAAGYAHKSASENISAGYRTIAEAFSGWRESKRHDAVMRHPTATRMGVGTAYTPNSKYKVFWSLIVAEPAE